MNYSINSIKLFFKCIIAILFLCSCNGQNANKEDCKTNFIKARTKLNKFYTENNPVLISDAVKDVEKSLDCPETRSASIDLKISALSLLKKYDVAYKFIDSLEEKDFSKPYKKKMQYNFFKALDCESKLQNDDKKKYFDIAITEIQTFINNQKTIDQESYYELFLVKSKILSAEQVSDEINILKIKYPADKNFFESLKESFDENPKQINASINNN
ncbi:hypothetical protein IR010_16225 [Flavobacterium sp. MR2016-29]|uniref:hypothetical protein n=1 Tax=Flavobacterium sp. MR2016-29 TaxID=2783795 RepID=UPI00188CF1D3|nr:hypothetical protein [Flavobacterium sp. MR2016-29]MBF4494097.1 hypothetical protein [Flavobacterium sp. MR2016-29]